MRYSTQVRSISFLKANAAEVMRQLDQQREPMVITQNGTAKAVIQDVASYDTTQETLALLKILALGNHQVEQGKVEPLTRVVERLRAQRSGAPFPGNFWRLASANTVRSSSSPSG